MDGVSRMITAVPTLSQTARWIVINLMTEISIPKLNQKILNYEYLFFADKYGFCLQNNCYCRYIDTEDQEKCAGNISG